MTASCIPLPRIVPCTAAAPLPVSVIVPTFRRPELLKRCLQALLNQDLDRALYEIVVVDDGPDAGTKAVVEAAAEAMCGRPAIRYMTANGTQGPAAARNVGWRAAKGRVIAFTDDDTIPSPSWLREGLRAMRCGADAACGRVRISAGQHPTDYEKDAARLAQAEFVTANCFVRREALRAIDGFDERFTKAWREDSDLQFMLLRRGGTIISAPSAIVAHPIRPAGLFECLRQQKKIFFDALLYKKHPTLYRLRIRRSPRWDYYAMIVSLATAIAAALVGLNIVAVTAALLWTLLTVAMSLRRLAGTSHRPAHVLSIILTSIAIPPLATYWRLVGALRFRTFFL